MTDPIVDLFILREAIVTVAANHPADCTCDICRAADGDLDAFGRVFLAVEDERAYRRRHPET